MELNINPLCNGRQTGTRCCFGEKSFNERGLKLTLLFFFSQKPERREMKKRKPKSSTVHYLLFVKMLYNNSRSNDGWAIKAYSFYGYTSNSFSLLQPFEQCLSIRNKNSFFFPKCNLLRSRLIKTFCIFFPFSLNEIRVHEDEPRRVVFPSSTFESTMQNYY